MPETRARTSTSREPSACPTASSTIGTRCGSTRCTVTGRAGGRAARLSSASGPLACRTRGRAARGSRTHSVRNARAHDFFSDDRYDVHRQGNRNGNGGKALLYTGAFRAPARSRTRSRNCDNIARCLSPSSSMKRNHMDQNPSRSADPNAPVARDLPSHGYVITKPVRGSEFPADYTFVLTRDEIYVPDRGAQTQRRRHRFRSSRWGAATAAADCLTSRRRSSGSRRCRTA